MEAGRTNFGPAADSSDDEDLFDDVDQNTYRQAQPAAPALGNAAGLLSISNGTT